MLSIEPFLMEPNVDAVKFLITDQESKSLYWLGSIDEVDTDAICKYLLAQREEYYINIRKIRNYFELSREIPEYTELANRALEQVGMYINELPPVEALEAELDN